MTVRRCGVGRRFLASMAEVSGGFEWSGEGAAAYDRGVGRRRSGEAVRSGTRLLIRRIRGWGGVKFQRPRAFARGYTRPQLRCSIGMAGRRRLAGQPTSTAASQLSLKSRQCVRMGFLVCMPGVSGGFEWSGEGAAAYDRGVGRRRSGEAVRSGTRLLIRRIRGWGGVKFQRPRAFARGYTRPQLRCSIGMAGRRRLAGQPTSTAASQLSLKSRQCVITGFFRLITGGDVGKRNQPWCSASNR